MRVVVIGAGIVGVTTAYELAADGHAVTVLERGPAVAGGASFANAGLVAPGQVAPWTAAGVPLLSQLLDRHAAVRLGWSVPWTHAAWLWRWHRAGRPALREAHRRRLFGLARYSRDRVEWLGGHLKLAYERSDGLTVLLRTDRELARARQGLKLLAELGVPLELLDAERTRAVEPWLSPETPLRGAIHLPRDGVGNCRQFAHLLKAAAEKLGADFRFRQEVQAVRPGSPASVEVAGQTLACDAVVVCTGADAPALLSPLGLKLPIVPVWGYSLTLPLRELDGHAEHGPRSALLDPTHEVAIVRLGRRVRVAGGAEIGGRPQRFHDGTIGTLYKVLHDWFPGATRLSQAQVWKGARAMLPDGPPILGGSGRPGVWLNVGHGNHGWALAAGSARIVADLVAGRTPAIDLDGLGAERWT